MFWQSSFIQRSGSDIVFILRRGRAQVRGMERRAQKVQMSKASAYGTAQSGADGTDKEVSFLLRGRGRDLSHDQELVIR